MGSRFPEERKNPYRAIWDLIEANYSNYCYCLLDQEEMKKEGYRPGPHPAPMLEKSDYYWQTILFLLQLVKQTDELRESVKRPKEGNIYLLILDTIEIEVKSIPLCIAEDRVMALEHFIPPYHLIGRKLALEMRIEQLFYLFLAMVIPDDQNEIIRKRLANLRMTHREVFEKYIDAEEVIGIIFGYVGWDEETKKHMRKFSDERRIGLK